MKQDIEFLPVEGITMAIAKEPLDELAEASEVSQDGFNWKVFILNTSENTVDNVIIASRGYGTGPDGEKQETSVLRHYIEELPGNSAAPVELISPAVFHLVNEYWVSYYIGGKIYDKKFLFMPDSVVQENIRLLPIIDLEGVLHD